MCDLKWNDREICRSKRTVFGDGPVVSCYDRFSNVAAVGRRFGQTICYEIVYDR